MNKPLFSDFNAVSSKQWKQKIQFDLKGADYNDSLIWKTAEGIDVKPFYHADEFENLLTTSDAEATQWKVSQHIEVKDVKDANLKAIDAINRGTESLIFTVEDENMSSMQLLNNIDTSTYPIHFNTSFFSLAFFEGLMQIASDKITFNNDIIGKLVKTGNWFNNLNDDFDKFNKTISGSNQTYIDLSVYQNAGATMTQQLAYALAHTNEYLNHLEDSTTGFSKSDLKIIFNVAIGSNYFFEIAKLRALRQLWATLAKAYNCNPKCKITATPSNRNKTIYDYNVNMLRTTTECMSAILGGADYICNQPYNQLFQNSTEFGERMSRNQLLILKNESYFNAVNNPCDGSYYIEKLTQQLAENALKLFKDIERNSGFLSQLKEGTIQRKIKESAGKEQANFKSGEVSLLGINKYPNTADKMQQHIEKQPFLTIEKRKTLIEPIIEKRLAEDLEIKRLKEE